MNKCLYCSKPCGTTTIFCAECRASLLKRQHSQGTLEQASSSALTQAPRARRIAIPTQARKVLIVLVIVGTIVLLVEGILLLTTYALQQHSAPSSSTVAAAARGIAFSRQTGATAAPGMTNTPASSPASGSPTPGTGTGAGKSWLQLSSPHLEFQYTQGRANPVGQSVTISNGDGNVFSWQVNTGSLPSWLSVTPMQGNVLASGSGQMTISVQATQLMPAMYASQLSVKATSSTSAPLQNSPQILTISLIVLAPCALQDTPAHLSFTTTLLQNPPGQTITLKTTGGCGLPVTWTATADASWVQLSSTSGGVNGSNNSIVVTTHMNSIPGTYTARIMLTAVDSHGMTVQSNPQAIALTLTVIV